VNKKKGQIFFRFSKISLLLAYIPFFIVQCFFNTNAQSVINNKTVKTPNYSTLKSNATATFINYSNDVAKITTTRLNKRFQQEDAPVCVPQVFEIPNFLVKATLFCTYPDPLLPSSHLLVNKLRGPPAVV